MTLKFRKRGDNSFKDFAQTFEREKITVTKGGKEYNVYDAIQAANVDTEIYDVMKKYNCTQDQAAEYMKEHGGIEGIYADLSILMSHAESMGDIINLQKNANEKFNNLPTEIKEKYGNNLEKFLIDVEKHAKELQKQKEEIKKEENNA